MNDSPKNEQRPLTITISVAQTPEQAFEAINNVRGWWSGDIEGPSDLLGGEFSYRYEDSLASVPTMGGYSASKAAAYSITQALRPELKKKAIHVPAALPGPIDTDMV